MVQVVRRSCTITINQVVVYEDQSGGDRPFFFYGASQNNQNLFGSSLGMDGGPNFGKIELPDRNYSEILLSDVTLPNLLHAWWPFDGDGNDYSGTKKNMVSF